mgnify:CR=1 FL=1
MLYFVMLLNEKLLQHTKCYTEGVTHGCLTFVPALNGRSRTKLLFLLSMEGQGKAGRLVSLADCYAVIVLADNATFLLAVNRIAASRWHSAIITSALLSWGCGFESHLGQDFSTCLCPLRHTRSVRNYPILASAERATPIPHNLRSRTFQNYLIGIIFPSLLEGQLLFKLNISLRVSYRLYWIMLERWYKYKYSHHSQTTNSCLESKNPYNGW